MLVKYGAVSRLDGLKNYLCLKCGADLAPPRSRLLLRVLLVVALLTPLALVAYAILFGFSITFWAFFPIACVADAITCLVVYRQLRRALRSPTPLHCAVKDFLGPKVRLVEITIRLGSEYDTVREWMTPFSKFVEFALDAAGTTLEENGSSGKVRLFVTINCGRRMVQVGFRGRVEHDALERLYEQIQKYPTAEFGQGEVSFEAWFRVYS